MTEYLVSAGERVNGGLRFLDPTVYVFMCISQKMTLQAHRNILEASHDTLVK